MKRISARSLNHFFEYVTTPKSLPAWEIPYMLAKYAVSTKGVEIEELMKDYCWH
jgi:hypothetical protein